MPRKLRRRKSKGPLILPKMSSPEEEQLFRDINILLQMHLEKFKKEVVFPSFIQIAGAVISGVFADYREKYKLPSEQELPTPSFKVSVSPEEKLGVSFDVQSLSAFMEKMKDAIRISSDSNSG